MNTIDIVKYTTYALAFVAGASKFLEASKPFWNTFPAWLQRILPSLVMLLGGLPAPLTGAQTWPDFIVQVIAPALALLLPSTHSTPPGGGTGGKDEPLATLRETGSSLHLRALALAAMPFGLLISGCQQVEKIAYPIAVDCSGVLVSDALQESVAVALKKEDYRAALDSLAADAGKDGPAAVKCAVEKLIALWSGNTTMAASTSLMRAHKFMAETDGVK